MLIESAAYMTKDTLLAAISTGGYVAVSLQLVSTLCHSVQLTVFSLGPRAVHSDTLWLMNLRGTVDWGKAETQDML